MKTIEAADNGIRSITRIVETAQATARQAIQTAGTTARVNGTAALNGPLTPGTTLVSLGFAAADTITFDDATNTDTVFHGRRRLDGPGPDQRGEFRHDGRAQPR